jgi:colicin import membrane protein
MQIHFMKVCVALALCSAIACNKDEQKDAAQAQSDAEAKARAAQQEANEKIAEAKAEAEKAAASAATARTEVKSTLQKEVDAVDRKAAALKERGEAAKGAAQKNYAAARAEFERRRSVVQADLRKLESESGAAWDAARTSTETDLAALKASVDSLENTITPASAK